MSLTMLTDITRSRLIQAWFMTLALVVAFQIVPDLRVTMGSAVMLLTLCPVPLGIVSTLWRVVHPGTVAEVVPDGDRRAWTTARTQALAMGDAPTDDGGFQ